MCPETKLWQVRHKLPFNIRLCYGLIYPDKPLPITIYSILFQYYPQANQRFNGHRDVEHVHLVLKKKCVSKLEALGDGALDSREYDGAIAQYTSALSLDPADPTEILVKRSKARVAKGLWGDALVDANEARASCGIHCTLLIHLPTT